MSDWRPCSDARIAAERARLLARARRYFDTRGVLAVDTPALGAATVTEPNIDSLVTEDGRFLQTSPEYYMKRLLAAGYPDIYSIGRVFRGAEEGRRHMAEFTMIEWYRHAMSLDEIVEDTLALIADILEAPDFADRVRVIDYAALFAATLGVDVLNDDVGRLVDCANADARLIDTLGNDRDAWLDLLLATRIVPGFSDGTCTVIRHFPASQGALARLCPDDRRVADRFEVFVGSVELANGYVELRDAAEQSARMHRDLEIRNRRGQLQPPVDHRLLAALEAGLPDCAGVALGFERLHMLAAGVADIHDVVTFAAEVPAHPARTKVAEG